MCIKKIKGVLLNPSVFFKNLSREKGLGSAFGYFALLSAVAAILSFVLLSLFPSFYSTTFQKLLGIDLPQSPVLTFWIMLVLTILSYALNLALSFLWAAILHIWIMIFGGEGKYHESYKLYIYAITPKVLLSWIPVIFFIGWIWEIVLLIIGTQKVYGLSKTKSVLRYVIPAVVLVILMIAFYVFVGYVLKNSLPVPTVS